MEDRKNPKQKKSERSGEVFSIVKEIYGEA